MLEGIFNNGDCIDAKIKYHSLEEYEGQMHENKYNGKGRFVNSKAT